MSATALARVVDLEAVSDAPAAASRIGTILDARYRLDAVLGTGGFGAVYRARHLLLGNDVAIKLLHAGVDANAAKRLTREAKILAQLEHRNCVRIMDFGNHEGVPYLVMELIAGRSLADELGQAWAPRRAVDVALELVEGLAHAHAHGLVHRDLKPSNVLLADDARGGSIVKIIDFGIVAVAAGEKLGSFTEQLTATGKIIGTPRYMSPEQLLGAKIDARSDLYALGLILHEMLAGEPAFEASDARRLAWLHAVAPPPLLPDEVPDELATLVEQLLAKTPDRRPASAVQVRERLLGMRGALPQEPSVRAPAKLELTARTIDSLPPTDAATRTLDSIGSRPRPSAPGPVDPSSLVPERRVGRYLLLRELGRGAMGIVYLAWDEALDRRVAIKLLRESPAHHRASDRMLREARGLARVTHPNVVGVFELGVHAGTLFVAMQYVPGRTLRAWQLERPRTWSESLARLLEAGRGLAAVHAAGLVHRDVKPENLLVGDDERARVVDFGLVRSTSPALDMVDRLALGQADTEVDPLQAKLTRTGAIIGTPAYMALEQLAGDQVDARSDQFAFCVVAYEALHGRRPFAGRSLEELAAKLTAGQIEPRPEESTVPRAFDAVLARGLQVMPSSRWPSMDALLDALEQAGGVRRSWTTRGLIAGGVGLALVVSAAWAFGSGGHVEGEASEEVGECASECGEDLEARNLELVEALERHRALLARARPEDPASWRDVVELAAPHRGQPMPADVRASLHAVAGAMHEGHALREVGEVSALTWSGAGSLLALARREGGIALWDADARALLRTLEYAEPLGSPMFSHDGELLLALDGSARAVLWHVSTGTLLGTIALPNIRVAGFAGDTRDIVISSDESLSLWGLVRGRELERTRVLSESADVRGLASVGERVLGVHESGHLSTWTLAGEEVARVELESFDADGSVTIVGDALVARVTVASLDLWDARTGKRVAVPGFEHPKFNALAFSPDGRTLAVAARSGSPLLIDIATGESRRAIARIADLPEGVPVLDHSGSRFAIVGEDGIAWVWSSTSVAIADELPPLDQPIEDVALSRDGERVLAKSEPTTPTASWPITARAVSPDESATATASGSWPAYVEVRTSTGERTHRFEIHGELRALAFSPDGHRLACAGVGPRVELWSLDEGARVAELRTAESEIHALVFSPDATLLAVAGSEVHLWQLDDRLDLATLVQPPSRVRALAFTPDGRQLVMLRDDGSLLRRWIDEPTLLDAMCGALERSTGELVPGCEHEKGTPAGPP